MQEMKMAKKNYLLIALTLTLFACKVQNLEQKFNWSATLSAPEEYPIEVISGDIAGDGYGQSFGHFGVHSPGWGSGGRTLGSGPDTKHIPDYLGITWISFAERKIYTGEFSLPKDKILALFKKGFVDIVDSSKNNTYDTFIVGLAPKGHISVWIEGDGNQVEVATFKAKETHIDTSQVREDDQYMFTEKYLSGTMTDPQIVDPDVQEKIKQRGYPNPDIYSINYRKKYSWQPKFILPKGFIMEEWWVMMCNGEQEYTLIQNNNVNKADRAIPYFFNLRFRDDKGNNYQSFIVLTSRKDYLRNYFDDGDRTLIPLDFEGGEIEQLFKTFTDKTNPLSIEINIDPQQNTIDVGLEQLETKKQIKNVQYHINYYGKEK